MGLYYDRIYNYLFGVGGLLTGIVLSGIGLAVFAYPEVSFIKTAVLRNFMCAGSIFLLIWLCGYININCKFFWFFDTIYIGIILVSISVFALFMVY